MYRTLKCMPTVVSITTHEPMIEHTDIFIHILTRFPVHQPRSS